jgi:hypothetical protein
MKTAFSRDSILFIGGVKVLEIGGESDRHRGALRLKRLCAKNKKIDFLSENIFFISKILCNKKSFTRLPTFSIEFHSILLI